MSVLNRHQNNSGKDMLVMKYFESSFPIIEFMESLESHYDDFSTYRPSVEICKISLKSPYDENFEYLLSNTF